MWTRLEPDVANKREVGSRCLYQIRKMITQNLGDRGGKAIFIGYASHQKSYKL